MFLLPISALFLTRVDDHSYSVLSRLPTVAADRSGRAAGVGGRVGVALGDDRARAASVGRRVWEAWRGQGERGDEHI